MSGWAGFSEDELRKIQLKESGMSVAGAARGRKPAPANRSRQQLQREKALQSAAQRHSGAGLHLHLPPDQQLTKPPPREEPQHRAPAEVPAPTPDVKQEEQPAAEEESPDVKELETQEVAVREKTRLEQLQQEQTLMEERNKRKKALLTKTIAEKSKQTQAEAVKLKRIQKELQALDDMVSNDIGILRSRIEQVSWEFSSARKRYEKAEAEYVMAKLDLHKKTEVKEQLTEHLCAIIQQNELRKAHKLEELMQQLQLQATEEELEKQKKEEEVEEKRRSCVETHGNGSVENQEGTVQSTKDCGAPEEESVKEEESVQEERGGDAQPTTEQTQTEQECKTLENGAPCEVTAS
ncbi:RAB6-interacting golgin [Labrus mixtus]|uniref:RAB6-interacting golgin n=1 Tax=Labrus mixtus TaxID=508554 RepID=UPI0029BFC862|nr:RAB6-interacting golgin [Labrus mixtus]